MSQPGRILVTDDEEKIVRLLGRALRDAGHEAVESTCPRQSLQFLAEKTFDVFGYNYRTEGYPKYREANPTLPLIASETASAISSRGEYFFPVTNQKDGQGRIVSVGGSRAIRSVQNRAAGDPRYLYFRVADAYLFVVTNWAKPLGIDLAPYPNLVAWRERVGARPAVQRGVKVLADRRKPQFSDKDKESLFGAPQYARR